MDCHWFSYHHYLFASNSQYYGILYKNLICENNLTSKSLVYLIKVLGYKKYFRCVQLVNARIISIIIKAHLYDQFLFKTFLVQSHCSMTKVVNKATCQVGNCAFTMYVYIKNRTSQMNRDYLTVKKNFVVCMRLYLHGGNCITVVKIIMLIFSFNTDMHSIVLVINTCT